jgi:hypothetical protein
MTAGRGQLERAPATFLSAYVGEVERTPPRLAVADDVLGRLELATEVCDRVRQVTYADRLDARQRSLGTRLVRTDDPLQVVAPRTLGHGENTADPTQASIESELAARGVLG